MLYQVVGGVKDIKEMRFTRFRRLSKQAKRIIIYISVGLACLLVVLLRIRSNRKHAASEDYALLLDQGHENDVIIDMRFSSCYGLFGHFPRRCKAITEPESPWIRVPKDIFLGKRWFRQVFLDYRVENKDRILSLGSSTVNEIRVVLGNVNEEDNKDENWDKIGYGVFVERGRYDPEKSITGLNVLFGAMATDPRPGWTVLKKPLKVNLPEKGEAKNSEVSEENAPIDHHIYDDECYISVQRRNTVSKEDVVKSTSSYQTELSFDEHGKFKILQVADAHFVAGYGRCRDPWPEVPDGETCLADLRTLKFIISVLDIEKPDLVVMTGDQVFGSESKDFETALFKLVKPFIDRKIPYAILMGNHDSEGNLSRKQIYQLLQTLPYSVSEAGLGYVSGYGNYALTVTSSEQSNKNSLIMYFLDSHSYSKSKIPGYDFLKQDQKVFVKNSYIKHAEGLIPVGKITTDRTSEGKPLSMAFFHIPLPEYRELKTPENADRPLTGSYKEGCTAPMHNSHMYDLFKRVGVSVVSVGHDHCNDYCLNYDGMNLCYGGGVGEGGYAGYGGTTRRLRIFEVDDKKNTIRTWKRLQTKPDEIFDDEVLFNGEEK